jgi:hypothetical protein
LGNDLAIKAYRDGSLPFPDGAIIAVLHWNEESSDADDRVLAAGFPGLGLIASFAGSAVNAQFMVKDSKKYAASGGWGFADFTTNRAMRRCTQSASPATRLQKTVTMFSLATHLRPELNDDRRRRRRHSNRAGDLTSVIGTKRTWSKGNLMSAFGGKADMTRTCVLTQ